MVTYHFYFFFETVLGRLQGKFPNIHRQLLMDILGIRPHYAGGFKNFDFTLRTLEMFSVHTRAKKFDNSTISGHFGFVFEENSDREVT